ncbi:galactose oxidase-like domain-containing protein [Actinoplanes solisilvae]|uniref:galactose oxidase-like domain-containing protein n=1 Tax=Actinoplanes solisilvae TaxID=2486853 RepID=UPI000FDCD8A3|nr:galactose oxidase-like domain-containing protein [Actinoplanes solisilvae]
MRTRRRLTVSGVAVALLALGTSLVAPAAADVGAPPAQVAEHGHDHAAAHLDDPTNAEHLAQDLVGTPMTTIEKRTAENAARIQKATGVRPGRLQANERVNADPWTGGSWSPVVDLPIVPVFAATLPNGKSLMWDSVGDNSSESYPDHSFTRAVVFNPADDSSKRVDLQGSNIFCAGFAHLPNGNILVAGGNANAKMDGIVRTYVFDWKTETWTRGNDMAAQRWYPSVAQTANGENVIIGGGPARAEVRQANGTLRVLPNFTQYGARIYPFMGSRPDTQLAIFGPNQVGYTLNTAGLGTITATGTRDVIWRDYASFATYDIGRTVVVGGGNFTEGGVAKVPSRTAVTLNSNSAVGFPAVAATGSMSRPRKQHNATLLADGSVLVTGGLTSTAVSSLIDLKHPATAAERWDPATGKWTVLSSASRIRQYHSMAMLLPDGRVMTGGGGICGDCVKAGYLEKNVEYFTPPYLFKKDGSNQLADRPVVSTAPATVGIGANFAITSPQAAGIRKVALVGLGDVTHSVDQGQRYVPLKYTTSGTTLTVTGPPTGGVAPPGYYMLFVIDAAGVPSVAKMVQVGKGPNPLMSPVRNSTGRCLDVPGSTAVPKALLNTYTCNNSKAQAMTRLTSDNSLRMLGNCADVPAQKFVSGTRIQTYSCNTTPAQKWRFGTDGTIRPISKTTLCLAAASAAEKAAVSIVTCNGSALQKWTW